MKVTLLSSCFVLGSYSILLILKKHRPNWDIRNSGWLESLKDSLKNPIYFDDPVTVHKVFNQSEVILKKSSQACIPFSTPEMNFRNECFYIRRLGLYWQGGIKVSDDNCDSDGLECKIQYHKTTVTWQPHRNYEKFLFDWLNKYYKFKSTTDLTADPFFQAKAVGGTDPSLWFNALKLRIIVGIYDVDGKQFKETLDFKVPLVSSTGYLLGNYGILNAF